MRFITLFYAILTLSLCSCNQTTEKNVSENAKIEASISSYLAAQNTIGDSEIDTLLTKTFIRNLNGIERVSSIQEHKANMHIFHNRFPDMTLTFPNRLIEDNQAYIEWIFTGTNTGTFGELTATGKKVKISGITHLYFDENKKIYREDVFYNELGLLQQLGFTLNAPITE